MKYVDQLIIVNCMLSTIPVINPFLQNNPYYLYSSAELRSLDHCGLCLKTLGTLLCVSGCCLSPMGCGLLSMDDGVLESFLLSSMDWAFFSPFYVDLVFLPMDSVLLPPHYVYLPRDCAFGSHRLLHLLARVLSWARRNWGSLFHMVWLQKL